jgi:hypothetical protein
MGALVNAIDAMQATVDHELIFALMEGAEIVATSAQTAHVYQNRTGRLEANTRAESVTGSVRSGYRVRVVGARPYGSFLEEGTARIQGFAFLLPAWERMEDAVAATVSRRLVFAL